MSKDLHPSRPSLFTLLIAWLIPGGGFLLHGRFWRGFTLLTMLLMTFMLGCMLHGGVVWPAWSMGEEGFNVINNISFLIQMGAGLPALISLAAGLHPDAAALQWTSPDTANPLYDLGSFYVLVCGAMNYFIVCNTYDRLFRPKKADSARQAQAK